MKTNIMLVITVCIWSFYTPKHYHFMVLPFYLFSSFSLHDVSNRWFLLICIMQSGKQCLCRYTLPTELGKGFFSNCGLNSVISDTYSDLKITSIADAVEGRINVTCNNGLVGCSCTLSLNILMV